VRSTRSMKKPTLEHALSEEVEKRIDASLGYPRTTRMAPDPRCGAAARARPAIGRSARSSRAKRAWLPTCRWRRGALALPESAWTGPWQQVEVAAHAPFGGPVTLAPTPESTRSPASSQIDRNHIAIRVILCCTLVALVAVGCGSTKTVTRTAPCPRRRERCWSPREVVEYGYIKSLKRKGGPSSCASIRRGCSRAGRRTRRPRGHRFE